MSQTLRCRPSELLHLTDPLTAFYTDRALFTFAANIENDQEAETSRLPDNAKSSAHTRARQRVLDRYLGVEASEQKGRFKSVG